MDEGSIEARLTAIEDRLGMEAGLRASLDRDLSTISQRQAAANHLIQALSITQSQHSEELATHTELLRSAHTKLDLLVLMLGRLGGDDPDDQTG
jgi:hypothetical protein